MNSPYKYLNPSAAASKDNFVEGRTVRSQESQGLQNQQTRIIYTHLPGIDNSAQANPKIFNKLHFPKQETADLKATLQCIADLITLGGPESCIASKSP